MIQFYNHPEHRCVVYFKNFHGLMMALDINTGYIIEASITENGNKLSDEEFSQRVLKEPYYETGFERIEK